MTGNFPLEKLNDSIKIVKHHEKDKKLENLKDASTQSSTFKKIGSAIFYGLTSVLIVFVNKILLTNLG